MSYCNELSAASRLNPRSLLVLTTIFAITAGASLFIASISGILAGLRYINDKDETWINPNIDEKLKRQYRKDHWGVYAVSFSLSVMALMVISGLIYMGSVMTIDNAGKIGSLSLSNAVIWPIVGAFVAVGILFFLWFFK
ncbi:hypothetical protein BJV78DRAFT_1193552 [Lactifluus subvellereus]|nr:hypothetical protein BJV78DRAFT_1193552 [Lactifluus subvellereus]